MCRFRAARRRVWWSGAGLAAALACAAPARGHQIPQAICFLTVDASAEKTDVALRVSLNAFDYHSNADLDTDGDGQIPPDELALHHAWLEHYLQRALLFLWNGRNHRPTLRDASIVPATAARPAELFLDMQVEGYDPERPFAVVSRLLADAADATTVATVRHAGRTEVAVLTADDYYASDAPPPSPLSTGAGPTRRTSSRRGRIVPLGSGYVELVYRQPDGQLFLYFLGPDRTMVRPIRPKTLSLKVKAHGADEFEPVHLAPPADALDAHGRCFQFAGSADSLNLFEEFEADLSVRVDGRPVRKLFHVAPEQLLAESPMYACPNCPGVASDRADFRCTRCGQSVVPVQGGRLPYADHLPRHGGQFFAARDSWHHVEGTLLPPREFRLYLYDQRVESLDAAGYKLSGRAMRPGGEAETAIDLAFELGANRTYWAAALPGDLGPPVAVSVSIALPHQKEAEAFEFLFVTTASP